MTTRRMNASVRKNMDKLTIQAWSQRVHVEINTKKVRKHRKTGENESQNTSRNHCLGEICKTRKITARNTVKNSGDECRTRFSLEFEKLRLGKDYINLNFPLSHATNAVAIQ